MDAYIYDADLYCEDCIAAIKAKLEADGNKPENPDDEISFDSGDWPKGPYPDGGGEADSFQHCADCGTFLENSLTTQGVKYHIAMLGDWILDHDDGNVKVLDLWSEHLGDYSLDHDQKVVLTAFNQIRNLQLRLAQAKPEDQPGPVWVIGRKDARHTGRDLYWHTDDGWVDLNHAERFTQTEHDTMKIPRQGEWYGTDELGTWTVPDFKDFLEAHGQQWAEVTDTDPARIEPPTDTEIALVRQRVERMIRGEPYGCECEEGHKERGNCCRWCWDCLARIAQEIADQGHKSCYIAILPSGPEGEYWLEIEVVPQDIIGACFDTQIYDLAWARHYANLLDKMLTEGHGIKVFQDREAWENQPLPGDG